MIEIGLAIGVASKSFAAVKAMVSAGRELEDTVGQLSAWFGAISDLNEAERQIKNPPLFRKLTNSKSVEQEAIEIFAAKRKAMAQEKELREIILYAYGTDAWREMLALRKKIKEDREKAVYNQLRRRKAFATNAFLGAVITIIFLGFVGLGYLTLRITSRPA